MMLHYVHDRIKDKELYYIIIDEVQLMDEFVDVLNSFRHIENADTYVTGSNSISCHPIFQRSLEAGERRFM